MRILQWGCCLLFCPAFRCTSPAQEWPAPHLQCRLSVCRQKQQHQANGCQFNDRPGDIADADVFFGRKLFQEPTKSNAANSSKGISQKVGDIADTDAENKLQALKEKADAKNHGAGCGKFPIPFEYLQIYAQGDEHQPIGKNFLPIDVCAQIVAKGDPIDVAHLRHSGKLGGKFKKHQPYQQSKLYGKNNAGYAFLIG